jgi:hypothetical protein
METKLSTNDRQELAETGMDPLDGAYMTWYGTETEAARALHAWLEGSGTDAYVVYRAALDREEAAARELQRLSRSSKPAEGNLLSSALGTTNRRVP